MKLFVVCFALSFTPVILFSAELSDWEAVASDGTIRPATPIPVTQTHSLSLQLAQQKLAADTFQQRLATVKELEAHTAHMPQPVPAKMKLSIPQELHAELTMQPNQADLHPCEITTTPDSPVSRKRLTPSDSTESPRARRTYSAEQKDCALKKTLSKSERIKSWLCCSTCSPCCN